MKTVKGDLIQLAQNNEFDVIVHGCNCLCNMGGGIARTISRVFPEAEKADNQTVSGDRSKLGTYSKAVIDVNGKLLTIVNGYTQFYTVRSVFKAIKRDFSGLRIGYPAIGAGIGGGDWNVISKIIDEELQGENHTFIHYSR